MSFFALEGNIGAGKSTLLYEVALALGEETPHHCVAEPVQEWSVETPQGKINLLKKFYQDKRHAFAFQMHAFTVRVGHYREHLARAVTGNVLVERSILCDQLFAELQAHNGSMEPHEYAVYKNASELWVSAFPEQVPKTIFFLNTPVALCDERIRRRARSEESSGIPLDYLQALEDSHLEHCKRWEAAGIRVVEIDGSRTIEEHREKSVPLIVETLNAP